MSTQSLYICQLSHCTQSQCLNHCTASVTLQRQCLNHCTASTQSLYNVNVSATVHMYVQSSAMDSPHLVCVMFFSNTAPSDFASASNFKAARLNGDMVKMMWNGATLGDSRGFPHYTVVIREGDFHATSKHGLVEALNALKLVRKVSNGNRTSLTLSGFDTHKTYTIQVGMHTEGGQGKYTYPSEYTAHIREYIKHVWEYMKHVWEYIKYVCLNILYV